MSASPSASPSEAPVEVEIPPIGLRYPRYQGRLVRLEEGNQTFVYARDRPILLQTTIGVGLGEGKLGETPLGGLGGSGSTDFNYDRVEVDKK